jgi:site-specific DNA recombinase
MYKAVLRKAGVRVISVTVPLDEKPESIILEGVLETFSEYYSANLSRVISRGMRQAVEAKGSRPGGTAPYGFRSVREGGPPAGAGRVTLEIVPHEAAAVRRMVELVLQGEDLAAISRALEAEGIRNRAGRRFGKSQLHRILHNPALVGDLRWNRQRHGTGPVAKPVEAWVTVRDAWPGILDRETFAKVATALAGRAPTPEFRRRPTAHYLLTGLFVCGQCGAGLSTPQSKGGRYKYYQCIRTMKEGKRACPGRRLPMGATDQQVVRTVPRWLFEEKRVARLLAWYVREIGADPKRLEKRERELARWEIELTARRERLLDALESGKVEAGVLSPRLARLDEERGRLQAQREEFEREKTRTVPIPTPEMFRAMGEQLGQVFREGPVPAAKQLLRQLVRKIVVPAEGPLKAELVIGKPRDLRGSGDEFATPNGWWSWGDSNPRPPDCQSGALPTAPQPQKCG